MIATFIHDSTTLKCYTCKSDTGGTCDDPLDYDKAEVTTCTDEENVCSTAKASIFIEGTQHNVGLLQLMLISISVECHAIISLLSSFLTS